MELLMIDSLKLSRSCSKAFPPTSRIASTTSSTTTQEMLCTAISRNPPVDCRESGLEGRCLRGARSRSRFGLS